MGNGSHAIFREASIDNECVGRSVTSWGPSRIVLGDLFRGSRCSANGIGCVLFDLLT